VCIGRGKNGHVDLVIVDTEKDGKEFRALKRIRKQQIDNEKRIEHVKNEKNILLQL
jgi:hypothetical protein